MRESRQTTLYLEDKTPVPLSDKFASGGEGDIFLVQGEPGLAAKVYRQVAVPVTAAKLRAMPHVASTELLQVCAWPQQLLFLQDGRGPVGFLMELITDSYSARSFCNPRERPAKFQDSSFRMTLKVCQEVVSAFALLHSHGHLVGDVNPSNLLIRQDGAVHLVDCDSFEVQSNGQMFACMVGVSSHTPPELQFADLYNVSRTTNHDLFGLAVLLFQMIHLGRHPFAGVCNEGPMSLERAIKEYRYTCGPTAQKKGMLQPAGTLSYEFMPPALARIFERAFTEPGVRGGRPIPEHWTSVLAAMESSLKQCKWDAGHQYPGHLASCPWCEVESRCGYLVHHNEDDALPLPPAAEEVLAKIYNVQVPPETAPAQIQIDAGNIKPTHHAVRLGLYSYAALAVSLAVGLTAGKLTQGHIASMPLVAIPTVFVVAAILLKLLATKAHEYKSDSAITAQRMQVLLNRWDAETRATSCIQLIAEAETIAQRYNDAPVSVRDRAPERAAAIRSAALDVFLSRFRIRDVPLAGTGASRYVDIESFGIWSAADVRAERLATVPGMSNAQIRPFLTWRDQMESRFRSELLENIAPAAERAIDNELIRRRASLVRDLENMPPRLETCAAAVLARREQLAADIASAALSQQEARANLEAVGLLGKLVR